MLSGPFRGGPREEHPAAAPPQPGGTSIMAADDLALARGPA